MSFSILVIFLIFPSTQNSSEAIAFRVMVSLFCCREFFLCHLPYVNVNDTNKSVKNSTEIKC